MVFPDAVLVFFIKLKVVCHILIIISYLLDLRPIRVTHLISFNLKTSKFSVYLL